MNTRIWMDSKQYCQKPRRQYKMHFIKQLSSLLQQIKTKIVYLVWQQAWWIHTITIKYKYRLDSKKKQKKSVTELKVHQNNYSTSCTNEICSMGYRSFGIVQFLLGNTWCFLTNHVFEVLSETSPGPSEGVDVIHPSNNISITITTTLW